MSAYLTYLSPTSVSPGSTVSVYAQYGLNSFQTAQLSGPNGNPGLGGNIVSDTQVDVLVGADVDPGSYSLTVRTADSNTSNALTLEVVSSAPPPSPAPTYSGPTYSSITPSSITSGVSSTLTFIGTNLSKVSAAYLVNLTSFIRTTLTFSNSSETQATAVFTAPTTEGTYFVNLEYADGTSTATWSNPLIVITVSAAPTAAPTAAPLQAPDYTEALGGISAALLAQADYSVALGDIKNSVDGVNNTLKTETNPILERMAVALETIAAKHSSIEEHVAKLRLLGEGDGIHWVRPHDWKGGASSFETTISDSAGTAIKTSVNMESKN